MTDVKFTSFALIGTGPSVGLSIVKAFLEKNTPILVIGRPSSAIVSELPKDDPNLKLVQLDVAESPSELIQVLREHKVDVLLLTINPMKSGVEPLQKIADAAKAAGVKLIVPGEFGTKVRTEEGLSGRKLIFSNYLKSIGLPTLRLYIGVLHESIPWLTCVKETGKFHVVGDGDISLSLTASQDVAGYVVHVLTTQPSSRLVGAEFYIEGQRATLLELGALYKNTPIVHVEKLPTDVPGVFGRQYWQDFYNETKIGGVGFNSETRVDDKSLAKAGNALWEGHKWLTVQEVLGL